MATLHPSIASNVKVPYLVEAILDLTDSAASATKTTITVPAESMVIAVGFELTGDVTGTTADATATAKVGAQAFSAAFDLDAGTVGDYSTATAVTPVITASDTTVDISLNAFTGTMTGGELRVFAVIVDLKNADKPGLVQLGS